MQNLDTDNVASKRRNPIIAVLFSRMHFMERRGSGFKKIKADYSLHKSNAAFDRAKINISEILPVIYELAEIETSVFRLANEIKKTAKRANALDKIQIPKYNHIISEIEEILAEKEREDFFRQRSCLVFPLLVRFRLL